MRYTEVRLKKLAHELMADIDKETVNFIPNYDESLTMPEVLPSKFPNLLVNGGNGIAVGMATNIPPHNLTEVCDGVIHLIEHPDATLKDILKHVQGPDFPTGGIIYGRQGFLDAYRDGRGILHLRAKSLIERAAKGEKDKIVIFEIPYQVNKSRLLESIAELVNEKRIEGVADIRDESDREGMRIVIEVKRGELPEIILNNLYKHTQLQISFGIIMLAIVDKQPKTLGLLDIMKYFVAHRKEVILRRTRFELRKAEERAHILEGLVICLDNLDAVIKLIRASKTVDEARKGLMEKFGLTLVQAQAVLELQLQRLAQLERLKIQEEYAALKKRIAELRRILKDEKLVFAIIVKELKEIKEEYGDERRTEIRDEAVSELRPEDLVKEEDVAIVYTSSGYIKRTSLTSYKFQARGGKGRRGIEMKAEDIVEDLYICSTHSYLLVFTNQGRLYWLKALEVPDVGVSGRGKPIVNLVEFQPGEKPASVVAVKEFSENQFVVMLTTDGVIKKTRLSDFRNVRKGGILAMNIRPKSELFSAQISTGKNNIVIGTKLGRALSFKESDVRPMGRTRLRRPRHPAQAQGPGHRHDHRRPGRQVHLHGDGPRLRQEDGLRHVPHQAPRRTGRPQPARDPQGRPRPGHGRHQRGGPAGHHRRGQGHRHPDDPGPLLGPRHAGRPPHQARRQGPGLLHRQGPGELISRTSAWPSCEFLYLKSLPSILYIE